MDYGEPDIERLMAAFSLEEPRDRVPYLEYWVTSREVKEYVLGKRLPPWDAPVDPEDEVRFVEKTGMDAVGVGFSWRPGEIFSPSSAPITHDNYVGGCIKDWEDLNKIGSEPDIGEGLERLERCLKATQGTNVGVYASITSIFDGAYLAVGLQDFLRKVYVDIAFVEHIMDALLNWHVRVVKSLRAYMDDLAFIFINDDISMNDGMFIQPPLFRKLWVPRMRKIVDSILAKGKVLTFHTDGKLRDVIPILLDLGFSAVHPVEPESNNIYALKEMLRDRICLCGNIHTPLLAYGRRDRIVRDVKEHIEGLAPRGGYVLGSSTSIFDGIPPENFLAMVKATQRYGKYRVA